MNTFKIASRGCQLEKPDSCIQQFRVKLAEIKGNAEIMELLCGFILTLNLKEKRSPAEIRELIAALSDDDLNNDDIMNNVYHRKFSNEGRGLSEWNESEVPRVEIQRGDIFRYFQKMAERTCELLESYDDRAGTGGHAKRAE